MTVWIKMKLLDSRCRPERKTEGAVGYDLVARLKVTVDPHAVAKIPTGVCLEMMGGVEAQVRPRSGLTLRGLIAILGTIDSDFRGEIGVLMHNTTATQYTIHPGDRIAQLVFNRVALPTLLTVEGLGETARGERGFGSTDIVRMPPGQEQPSCPACGLLFGSRAPQCFDCGVCLDCHQQHPQQHPFIQLKSANP